jgi:hypothetical protein
MASVPSFAAAIAAAKVASNAARKVKELEAEQEEEAPPVGEGEESGE